MYSRYSEGELNILFGIALLVRHVNLRGQKAGADWIFALWELVEEVVRREKTPFLEGSLISPLDGSGTCLRRMLYATI